jgi:CAAX protease family protein
MSQQLSEKQLTTTIQYFPFWKKMLHIIPGLVTLIAFLLLKPIVTNYGYPPLMAFTLAVLIIDIPLLLGILFYQGKKLNQRFSLKGIVLNLEQTKAWKFLGVFLLGAIIAAGLFSIGAPIDLVLGKLLSPWLPDWMYFEKQQQYTAFSKPLLIQTLILWTVVTGLLLPVVEELYFRGYLLPRMSSYKINAVVANAALFALYHLWHPHGMVTFFLLGLLFSTAVLIFRDIRLSIVWHIIGNLQLRILVLLTLLR